MNVRAAAVLALLSVTGVSAQQSERLERATVVDLRNVQTPLEVLEPPEPPPGTSSWSLRIHTTGGFMGTGVGSVTISSDGQMACGPAPCATPIAATMLQPFTTMIASVVNASWIRQMPTGFCRDCIQTTIALKRRDGDLVHVYRASWDDSQPAPAELRELRRLALELRATRAAR